ncbi:hypothetical protein [Saccharophagus degradans]|uniref:DUF202 domain-containing protein n=1 Tax=Saccharophagus degradans TaxID=86304 RepID=A0AAW7X0H6_9GAMM|nr:hypothetical protein [Saccharophagus degradans]MDO6420845.1 hypothetical protein [Saccharophagus degradans]MDO6609798.1 hypothetical protein [Saccharophagus degradans]
MKQRAGGMGPLAYGVVWRLWAKNVLKVRIIFTSKNNWLGVFLSVFRLAVSGMGSNPVPLALFLVAVTLLIVFGYIKNRMLTTLESGLYPDKEGNTMGKVVVYGKIVIASVAELVVALGASLLASGGPLT